MTPAIPHVITNSRQAWLLIEKDYTLRLSLVANKWATEHLRAWNSVFAEGRKRGNSGYCGPALVDMEIADADKRAEWSYRTCCEIWELQGRPKCRPFFRAIFDWCLQPMFSMREGCFKSGWQLHQQRTRQVSHSGILGHMARQMGKLRAKWNTKLEIATRDNDYQEGLAREPNRSPTGTIQRNQDHERMTNGAGLTTQWRELREQFAALALEERSEVAPGYDPYISASVVAGDGVREWTPTRVNKGRSARFEAFATRAASLLGDAPKGRNLVDLWLESLFLDLLLQRKGGAKVTHLRFARKPGEGGIIERVCEESATFCVRLETKAYAEKSKAGRLASAPEAKAIRKSAGRKPKRNPEFVRFAGGLWRASQDSSRRVTRQALKLIAARLDASPFSNPSDWLEGKAAIHLKVHNKKFGNSSKKVLSWTDLVAKNAPDFRSAMRKLLSRCAETSGN